MHAALALAAALLAAAFVSLGVAVSRRPLMRLDVAGAEVRGFGTRAAVLFTWSGRSRFLTVLCCLLFAIFAALRMPLWSVATISLAQIVSQTIVELCKRLFRRVRPDYWLVGKEAGHSYPSGHATTALVFYGGWAIVVATLPQTVGRDLAIALLGLWAAGVAWSRLALGAHYVSDVIGGLMFGAVWLCLMLVVGPHYAILAHRLVV